MVVWYHQVDGHEFEQAPGDSDGQAWCAAVHAVQDSDSTERPSNKSKHHPSLKRSSTQSSLSQPPAQSWAQMVMNKAT